MKFVEFKYTKADGSVSDRAIIELVTPTKYVEGIDVTQLPEVEFAAFTTAMAEMKRTQHEQTMQLLADFDLKHNYRKFIPEQMTNVISEFV
jgi:hypothetical protein